MITTNYLISKQLAEAGFSEQVGFLDYYFNTDKELRHRDQESYSENTRVDCFSYDLETILEALPEWIHDKKNCSSEESLELGKDYIQYSSTLSCDYHRVDKQENESLADTVAKMWLKLKQEGLV